MIVLSNVVAPSEGVRVQQPQVVAWMENECLGEGTLTVAEGNVTWMSRQSGTGFSLSYPSIILHAVSTDLSSFPHECLYVLVDASKSGNRPLRHRGAPLPILSAEEAQMQQDLNLASAELDNEEDEEDEEKSVPVRFVPADLSVLQSMYNEMCTCQELHPDEGDDFSDDEEMGGETGAGEIQALGNGQMPAGRWFTAENMHEAQLSEEGLENLRRMTGEHNGDHDMDEEH